MNRMNSDSCDSSVCDTCGSPVEQFGTNDNMSDTTSTEQIVSTRLSWTTKIFFSFGHVYNDLCASVWFSYTLIFFQMQFNGSVASILILLGQVADALATPFVGFFSDRNDSNQLLCRYGKRKTWHLLGSILVSAAVQVGHVSLITDLTTSGNCCFFYMCLYDRVLIVYIVCAIGAVFSVLFNIVVKEVKPPKMDYPYSSSNDLITNNEISKNICRKEVDNKNNNIKDYGTNCTNISYSPTNPENGNIKSNQFYKWSDWLKDFKFYKVASIAIIPFVTYISGFIWSLISRFISNKTGSKILLVMGCLFGLASCVWNSFGSVDNESFKQWQVYGAALLFGIGGTTMLIASLSLTSDLIGNNTTSSAFVFGTMSFFDKVLNGSVVVILEQINPYKNRSDDESFSNTYYKQIVVYVSGAAALLTLLAVIPIMRTKASSHLKYSSKYFSRLDREAVLGFCPEEGVDCGQSMRTDSCRPMGYN
ncbi:unnamed protein product [Medioppia subpectinata]|uniref:Major facilitator superfamily domain-containing protein 12 n=1 Tax=Medioppia subpectinata TaxID=1979941 RepID=A0A7R9KP63_9ACAR|nr:unnamed protein product [Medioppia subpectinata]CAG2107216.1 unnamed protein product [Medioppia subpectinata]